jgi:D-glycero-alpha-D-manno-heptose-7-phosphate kinase
MTTTVCAKLVPFAHRIALAPRRRAVATAPMRVSFAGGGTDLPPFLPGIGGRVVGTAIDLRVRAEVEPFDRGWVHLELSTMGRVLTRRQGDPKGNDIAFRLLEAALTDVGVDEGVRLRIETDVIPGAGLGGSAAAAVAVLAALWASILDMPSADQLSRDALRVERDGLRLACGLQDPTFAAFGGVLDLRFDEHGTVTRAPLPVSPSLLAALDAGLLLVDTGQRRVSGEVLGRVRTGADITAELVAAAEDVARGFAEGSLAHVIAGMRRSAAAKLRRGPAVNGASIALSERLEQCGAEVVRVCGAGEGGHILVWAPPSRHAAIAAALGCTVRKPKLAASGVRLEAE